MKTALLLCLVCLTCLSLFAQEDCDCVLDFLPPTILDFEPEVIVPCDWDESQLNFTLEDECLIGSSWSAEVLPLQTETYFLSDATPDWTGEAQAVKLFNVGLIDPAVFTLSSYEIEFTESGIHIQGSVAYYTSPDDYFDFEISLADKKSWTDWSDQAWPTSFLADFDVNNHYLNWNYYVMTAPSNMTGHGKFEGSQMTLTHAPSNYFYGIQMGYGANTASLTYGLGGWFYFEGDFYVDGVLESENGSGGFSFDVAVCQTVAHTIEIQTTDNCGNQGNYTQTLTADPSGFFDGTCDCTYTGCTDPDAINWSALANIDDGSCVYCPGDSNNDGLVNVGDLLLLLSAFGTNNPDGLDVDFNGDGFVDTIDLLVILVNWQAECY